MIRSRTLALAIVFIACATTCVESNPIPGGETRVRSLFGYERVRGIFGSPQEVWKRGHTLSELNVNAVFIGHRRLNADMIRRCRREGARVFFEITIFAGKKMVRQHPELHPIGVDGKPMKPDGWYLGICPTAPWYRENRFRTIQEVLGRFDVDGVWLDFIRFPCHWETTDPRLEQACFCDSCLAAFEHDTGVSVRGATRPQKAQWILRHHSQRWTQWKCMQIVSFCQQVRQVIARPRSKALLGIFSIPWRETDYNDAIHRIMAQDFALLSQHVDVFSPMLYHVMCGFTPDWVGNYTEYFVRKTGRPVVPIVQAVDHPSAIAPSTFEYVLALPVKRKASGVMMYTIKAVMENDRKFEALRRLYH